MQSTKVAAFVTMLALCSACSSSSQARPDATVPSPSSSTTVSRAAIPEATSTPIAKCDDATTEALVRRFAAEFNAGAIDKVDALFVPRGVGFRFLSTPKTGADTDQIVHVDVGRQPASHSERHAPHQW